MGWNSWNQFGWKVDEEAVRGTADALVSTGLKDSGYRYLVIDDCWTDKRRGRDEKGRLVPDPERFPGGMKVLADYAHERGLKIGIYSCAADLTCGGFAGSYGHEFSDAAQWAEWGFDYLKYDYCYAPQDQASAIERYAKMGEALKSTGREFLFSICEWGGRAPHLWGRSVGGSMWRVSGDLFDSWIDVWVKEPGYYGIGVDSSIDIAAELAEYGSPGGWNDLDMLIVGLKGRGSIKGPGLSDIEYRTHMSVWAMACSPLMIGCDVRSMDEGTKAILMNHEIIAINQDPLGIPARRIKRSGDCELWRKPLSDGAAAIAVINRGSKGSDFILMAADAGLLDSRKKALDAWSKEEMRFGQSLKLRVEAHEARVLRISMDSGH